MCLVRELRKRGLTVESQVPIAVRYEGELLDAAIEQTSSLKVAFWLS